MLEDGDPIRGELTSADVTTATAIPIYDEGSLTARTLGASERIIIDEIYVFAHGTSGVTHVFVGADGTPGAGETVLITTIAASAQSYAQRTAMKFSGSQGHIPRVVQAVAGAIHVLFSGRIVKT